MKKNYKRKLLLPILIVFAINCIKGQQSYTFTPCGATGSVGPTQTQVNSTYSNTNLNGQVTTTISGIQTWTVPYTGNFRIEARGAQGGTCNVSSTTGGFGATMIGDFALIGGEVIQILVGQQGEHGTNLAAGGGGGGSFVVRTPYTTTTSILVIAGGGTGGGNYPSYPGFTVTTAGTATNGGAGGTNGSGGGGGSRAAGGGGFLTDGGHCTVSQNYSQPGQAFVNGGRGGDKPNNTTCTSTFGNVAAQGGFGGGASHGGNCIPNGGAGGGYSGGGGSYNDSPGGGASINQGTNQFNTEGNNSGDGKVIITELCSVKIYANGTGSVNPAICSGTSLTLTTDAVSNFSWSTGATTKSIVVAPTTNIVYTVSGTSSVNCIATGVMSVTVNSGVPVIAISNPSNNICLGKTVSLTATGALSYTWANPGVVNGQTFTPTSTAIYTVTGKNGCGTTIATTTINVAPLPVTVSASPAVVCQGYNTTLTAQSSVNGYTWSPAAANASLIVIAPTTNVIYTVVASDGTCSGTSTVAIATKVTPIITASTNNSLFCEGGSAVLNASGGSSYVWTPGNQTGASINVSPNVSTAYQVAGTNSVGCTGYTNVIIVVNANPTVNAVSNKTLVCENGTATLTASGADTYTWTGGTPNSATYLVNPQTTTQYTVTGTGQNGCTNIKMVTVSVYLPTLAITASTNEICPGGQVSLSASTNNGTNYKWNGLTGSSFQLSPSSTTVYVATANSNSNSVICPTTNSIQITVNPNPVVTIVASKTVMCRNEKAAVLTASGAATYAWSNNGATTNTIAAAVNTSGNYIVTGTDVKGCQGTANIAITVNPCTGIVETSSMTDMIKVYPNPGKNQFNITGQQDMHLQLLNELGQLVQLIDLNAGNQYKGHVTNLPAGIYFISGQVENQKIAHKVVITD